MNREIGVGADSDTLDTRIFSLNLSTALYHNCELYRNHIDMLSCIILLNSFPFVIKAYYFNNFLDVL